MPRLNLTEEETLHIKKRREEQRHFIAGYNLALTQVAEAMTEPAAFDGAGLISWHPNSLRDLFVSLRKELP